MCVSVCVGARFAMVRRVEERLVNRVCECVCVCFFL